MYLPALFTYRNVSHGETHSGLFQPAETRLLGALLPDGKSRLKIVRRFFELELKDCGIKGNLAQVTKILVHKLTFHSTVVCIAAEGATGDVALKKLTMLCAASISFSFAAFMIS